MFSVITTEKQYRKGAKIVDELKKISEVDIQDISENLKQILQKEAEKAKESELLIGIDPESYLGKEILKQSREIIALRYEVREVIGEHNCIKKERQKQSCLKKILLAVINKIK